jgi:hypothetical protein
VHKWKESAFRVIVACLLSSMPLSNAQEEAHTKVAEGEYKVTLEGDLGVGPIETEVFHFRESWTLWRTNNGYELEGRRTYESPRDRLHGDNFIAQLGPDLHLLSIKEFAPLAFGRDSGPLTCLFLPRQLKCDSGGKDPAHRVNVQFGMDRPYGLIWPLSAFSLAGLTRAATTLKKPTPVQVVQLKQLNDTIPVLAVRSDGLIRYLGQSETALTVSGKIERTNVYELTASPIGKMTIWTSQEGLLLVAERPSWPKGKMELVKFKKFSDF